MRGDEVGFGSAANLPDEALWRHSRTVELSQDESERFLDLAAFAEDVLDADERERVAEWLAGDPAAAADVAAARALAAVLPQPATARVVARACRLVEAPGLRADNVIFFRTRFQPAMRLRDIAGWCSLAAAMAMVGWLGFNLGMDTSLSLVQIGQGNSDGFLQEMFDPSTGLLRDVTEGAQT